MNSSTYTLNASNIVPGSNNTRFRLTFTNGQSLYDKQLAINSISLPFSNFNVSSALNNTNVGTLVWPIFNDTITDTEQTGGNTLHIFVADTTGYANGEQIFLSGLTTHVELNDLALSPITVVSMTEITVPHVAANYGSTADTGGVTVQLLFPIILPPGGYAIADVYNFIITILETNSLYMITPSGSHYYPISLVENPTAYSITFNSLIIPTAFTGIYTGYTLPDSYPGALPVNNAVNPQINFADSAFNIYTFTVNGISYTTNGFTGLSPGYQPPNNATYNGPNYGNIYSINGLTPNVNPIANFYVNSTTAFSYNNANTTVLAIITPNVTFGDYINYQPPQFLWTDIRGGVYQSIDIYFTDGLGLNTLIFQDPSINIQFSIADKPLALPLEKKYRDDMLAEIKAQSSLLTSLNTAITKLYDITNSLFVRLSNYFTAQGRGIKTK